MRTVWGYDVSDSIAPIISEDEFNEMTGGTFYGNARVEVALKAASQAIRNYCGWHICPAMTCTANPAGGSCMIRLPAAYVSGITSVKEDNATVTEYEWRKDGLIRRTDRPWSNTWDGIEVVYTAGYASDAVPDLAEAVCSIASGVLAISPGVTAESADGVTISYRADASSIAASLTSQHKSALEPYKVVSTHAA